MEPVATAIAPTLVLIFLGFVLRRTGVVREPAWSGIEKLTYFVLFPALLVHNISVQSLDGIPWGKTLLVIVGTLGTIAAALIVLKAFIPAWTGPAFTSVFQGSIRFNTYIALAVAAATFGAEGLRVGALISGALIILINLLCVTTFAIWGSKGGKSWQAVLRNIATNPLILACLAGVSVSVTGVTLAAPIADSLEVLSKAALPAGLLTVGAVLQPAKLTKPVGPIAAATLMQFFVKPLLAIWLLSTTGLESLVAGVLLIAFVTPAPPSAYILSRQLGGDDELMVSIITLQTLLAFAVMPAIIALVL